MSERVVRLREHPQLGLLRGLSVQLELLPDVLAAVHGDEVGTEALRDQARSIARVARILGRQLDAYEGLLRLPTGRRR